MENNKIIGRIKQCEQLQDCLEEDSAQLIVVYGRRRIGKTYLINNFFNNEFAFKLTGAYKQTRNIQLRNFKAEYERKTNEKIKCPKDWIEAFQLLRTYLEKTPKDKKQVVFFDEMPWLDTYRSGFLGAFEWFWNDFASTQNNLIFIVCGSATSWMIDNIDKNKGGLFNRYTCKIFLKPFSLLETKEYLESKNFLWSLYEITECYMILGGIPFYLSLLKKKLSLSQNIDRLFFESDAELADEFSNLYATLFSNSENYIKVVESLSKKKEGLTRNEIAKKTKLTTNGALTKILNNLVDSGFVKIQAFYDKKKKDAKYQLADYYTAFYFHFIKDNYGIDSSYWSNSSENPSRRAWEGLTFEQVCKDHVYQIKQKLGISGVLSKESIWSTTSDEEKGILGAQIDLVIKRKDNVINLCEIKFSKDEFIIDKDYDLVLRNKVSSFIKATNSKASIQLTLITTYGLKKNMYSNYITNEVTLEDLFN